jgi:WD40 repeat protein
MFGFSPDGKRLLFADRDRKALHLLDLEKGEVDRVLQHEATVFAGAFSPDGKYVTGGGYDKKDAVYFARLWDAESGKEVRRFQFGNRGIRSLAFSRDGSVLAIGADSGKPPEVKLFDVGTARELLTIPFPGTSSIKSLAFSPDGKALAASGRDATRLFDTATGKERVKIDRGQAIGLRFSQDGAVLVGAVGGTVYRWEAATGRSLIPEGGESPVGHIAVSNDGKRMVSLGHDGDAHVWDARTGEHQRRIDASWQSGMALSPDGRFLVWRVTDDSVKFKEADEPNTTYHGSRLQMLDLVSGKMIEDRFGSFAGSPDFLFFTPDGKTLVTADRYRRGAAVRLWNPATGEEVRSLPALGVPGSRVWRARLSPDGKVLAVLYHGPDRGGLVVPHEIRLWDLAAGEELMEKPPYWAEADDVMAFAPDGKTIAIGRPNGAIEFRDATTRRLERELRGPREAIGALAFGPNGQFFTGYGDGTVMAWDAEAVKFPPTKPN